MTFTVPAALWGLGALPLIILLHLLVRTRRRQVVASTLVWREIPAEIRRRTRLRALITPHLLAQLVTALLLVVAAADPQPAQRDARSPRILVLLIDVSASMQTVDEGSGRSRIEQAREEAAGEIARVGAATEVAVITFGARATLVARGRADDPGVRDAVSAVGATDEPAAIESALEIADSLTPPDIPGRTIVITDGALELPSWYIPIGGDHIRLVGADAPNLAITRVDASSRSGGSASAAGGGAAIDILVELRAYGAPAEARLVAEVGGRVIHDESLALATGASAWRTITAQRGRGVATISILPTTDDRLDADNVAWISLAPPPSRRVAVRGDADTFLRAALTARSDLDLTWDATASDEATADLVVAIEQTSLGAEVTRALAIRTPVQDAPVAVVGPSGRIDGLAWHPDHPVSSALSGTEVAVGLGERFIVGRGAVALLTSGDDVAAWGWDDGDRRVVGLGFRPEASSIALHEDFPLLIHGVIGWLFGDAREGPSSELQTGSSLVVATRPGEEVTLDHPDGRRTVVAAQALDARFERLTRAGLYRVTRGASGTEETIAVNIASRTESDLSPRPATIALAERRAPPSLTAPRRRWWLLLALAAVILLAAEGWIWARRRTA